MPDSEARFPGAVAPVRRRILRAQGLRLNLCEWGAEDAEPLVLAHGFYDHARSFDTLAPLLAQRYRVIAYDARGHGDSEWAAAYDWRADVLDLVCVLRNLPRPALLVGHSRGGVIALDAAMMAPRLVRKVVSMDGFGPPTGGFAEWSGRAAQTPPMRLAAHLDWLRRAAWETRSQSALERLPGLRGRRVRQHRNRRPAASLAELARSRGVQNPRLSEAWLLYFTRHGARQAPGGYTWKADPLAARLGGVGPFQPEWTAMGWRRIKTPTLAVWGDSEDVWRIAEPLRSERLAEIPHCDCAEVPNAGHFLHIEQPAETARALLDWLSA